MKRRDFLRALGLAAAAPAAAKAAPAAAAAPRPELLDLRVRTSGAPLAGDRRLLATVTPRRARAIVSFRLPRPARVRVEAIRTDTIRIGRPAGAVVWRTERRLGAGPHEVVWRPAASVQPRTYLLRVTVIGPGGRVRVYGGHRPRGKVDGPVVRVQGVDVVVTRTSCRPGDPTDLLVACDAPSLRFQVFHYGGSARPVERDLRTNGIPVTPPVGVDWSANVAAPARLRVLRAGQWQSGLYFVRATAPDGRVGYAPFILRPSRLGRERVAVVLATNTWQAYNFHDADGDGWGDSWYVSDAIRSVEVARPYLDFGVPFRFRDWDLAFIAWLNRTGKRVDFLADEDVEAAGTGDALRRAYDLVVFPGHEEYVTEKHYAIVRRYRDLGGNLLFLSANNFFWRVRRDGRRIVKERLWRDLGRPESGLVGVQYCGSDNGQRQGPFTVVGADRAPWAFAGTGLANGARFGRYGIEIDQRTEASPPGTLVLAHIPDLMGKNRSAEMTYYETRAGARVFAAGALNFAASLEDPQVGQLLENVWARLAA
ncbi:MAG TPA: N,N-dimethylformamidase beta subunit family domain-containing protein [Gaiellaceae bacterium]|nr:N,N-dimethylformamidase beta subunit family domain-containing protein [Gaiellaceae bacterium]